ncbi:MAG: hypothetical protein WKF79_00470 [Nocardioides sp.]
MTAPSVTYTGGEVAFLAGFIAASLPSLNDQDFDVADLMLDRALGALTQPLAPDIADRIAALRVRTFPRMEDTDK